MHLFSSLKAAKVSSNVSTIHKRLVHVEKQSFVTSVKSVIKSWAERGIHNHIIYLRVHYIIEIELNGGISRLHQLNKSCTRKRRRSSLAIIQSISADFNDFCKRNFSEKAADVIRAEKDR